TQGVLWTGIQVILLKRWAEGKEKVDSLFDSIGSFYAFGLPFLFIFLPLVTLLEPLLPLALAVTLILTAFACATLALSLVDDATERGAMVITAMAFSVFEPWLGLLVGLIAVAALCGPSVFKPKS
nr:xanthine permease [Gammaproteobacteria bacterium]